MKRNVLFLLLLCTVQSIAQNIGIGTPAPARPLHLKGFNELLRIQGASPWIGFLNNTDADYKGFVYYPDTALVMGSASGSNQPLVLAPNNQGLVYATAQQRVGIGTPSPTQTLDVNGTVNIAGNLRINNVAGQPSQVLMTNASGNTVWGSMDKYKKARTFQYADTWVVPAGVTNIFFEAWGGGGGSTPGGGGAGGCYASGQVNVFSGETITITVGAGGSGSLTLAGAGGTSALSGSFGSVSLAMGGGGAFELSPGIASSFSSGAVLDYFFMPGQSGAGNSVNYAQRSAGQFVKIISLGQGGGTYRFMESGQKGGTIVRDITSDLILEEFAGPRFPRIPGIGAAASKLGMDGANGMVIIYY